MPEEQAPEQQTLTRHEENWVIHLYCSVPYHEIRKIDDAEERVFLLQTAAVMKHKHEEQMKAQQEKEKALEQQLMSGLQAGSGLVKP